MNDTIKDRNSVSLKYWIRPASLTTDARQEEISELFDKFNSVPFDDRVNRKAKIDDIMRGYLEDFIQKKPRHRMILRKKYLQDQYGDRFRML